jgi:hypothetical protein
LYLKDHDLTLAEYYEGKYPLEQQAILRKKIQTQKKYKKVHVSKQELVSSYDQFLKAVRVLAQVFTFGSGNIQPNIYRARKYIRILRLGGDEPTAEKLTKHWWQQQQQNNKIIQELKKKIKQ